MNREIKFRGKRLDTGEWVYGWLGLHDLIADGQTHHEVDPATVGQKLPNVQDKYHNPIYEGDIYSCKMIEGGKANVIRHKGWSGFDLAPDWAQRMEIIGNIHDNPELLEDH